MKIKIDKNIYSDACISKAVYALSDRYAIARSLEGTNEVLAVCAKDDTIDDTIDDTTIQLNVLTVLNDYKLRQAIEDETHDIRTILYAKAFADCEDLEDV